MGHGEDELFFAGFEVDAPEAGVGGGEDVFVGVGDAVVTVAGTGVVEAAEVGGDAPFAIGTEGVEGAWEGAFFAGFDVEEVADQLAVLTVVPHDGGVGAGDPLEHAALLPVPGVRGAEFDPFVVVLEIDHADLDDVVGFGGAVLEVDLIGQDVAVVGGELQFVVVPEPVEAGLAGDLADGGERGGGVGVLAEEMGGGGEGEEAAGGGAEEVAAVHGWGNWEKGGGMSRGMFGV